LTSRAIRLALSVVAGALFGLNRGESGKVAGLRTTLLVCLAACVAMLQVNALPAQAGKQTGSFAVLDLMRLPLGILSGVGFIGAGAILRKDGMVKGVTTAATLWIVTVIGLCFGGGQIGIGLAALVLGLIVLWFLERVERIIPRLNSAVLTIEYDAPGFSRHVLLDRLKEGGCTAVPISASLNVETRTCEERLEVRWRGESEMRSLPPLLEFAAAAGASRAHWSIHR
jgi:putative Mg2+ transporter-C (MgtC) family protein